MTCGHCQKAVKTALENVPGTKNVQVDLEAGAAQVTGSADVSALISAIEEEGYSASATG